MSNTLLGRGERTNGKRSQARDARSRWRPAEKCMREMQQPAALGLDEEGGLAMVGTSYHA